jgi:prepilin-type N-terminal cleavage/methylation domain-containing protein
MIKINKQKSGFSLVEIILAIAIFSLLLSGFSGLYLSGQEATMLAGNRAQAVLYAEEGLEAVRNIRDENFMNLNDGTYGLGTSGNQWVFVGSQDSQDIFTREIKISAMGIDKKEVEVVVSWQQNLQREGEVSLKGRLTHWMEEIIDPDPDPQTCEEYCMPLPPYTGGVCRQNARQCERNDQVYESGGDLFCPGSPNTHCCCN